MSACYFHGFEWCPLCDPDDRDEMLNEADLLAERYEHRLPPSVAPWEDAARFDAASRPPLVAQPHGGGGPPVDPATRDRHYSDYADGEWS